MSAARYFLRPGELVVTLDPAVVTTVLGSCVAVYLRDRRGAAGVNHFVLPRAEGAGDSTGRYGDTSLRALVALLRRSGVDVAGLVARVYGGAQALGPSSRTVGAENVRVALELLAAFGIPVESAEVGGTRGRKLVIDTAGDCATAFLLPPRRPHAPHP